MTISVEALLVASLMMAVFAAVATVGTSLFLGAGFERLRAGFENIKKQTAFFSDSLRQLDGRVDRVEKQGAYYFEAIGKLEHQLEAKDGSYDLREAEQEHDAAPAEAEPEQTDASGLICTARNEADSAPGESLLTSSIFSERPAATPQTGHNGKTDDMTVPMGELRFH